MVALLSPWPAGEPVSPAGCPSFPSKSAVAGYLVSPYGESDWVRNLRAAGKGELSRKGRTEAFDAVEVPVDQRSPVIARYREVAGRVVSPCFTKLPDARDHPVFQID
jgi:hypothetical protein